MSTHTLRKRFVKDQGLPINLVQDGYFQYFLDLYEKEFGANTKYEEFLAELEKYENPEDFLQYMNTIQTKIITETQNKEAFQTFNDDKLKAYETEVKFSKNTLYRAENHGKRFISIDLVKANFHALQLYDPAIVDNCKTYDEWIKQYSDSEYLLSSKQVRQIVFGHLNPKKQMKIEKYITSKMVAFLLGEIGEENIFSVHPDEVVILQQENYREDLKEKLEEIAGVPLHFDEFQLIAQEPVREFGFVKKMKDGTVVFKDVPKLFFPQAYKQYTGLALTPYDLAFYHEGFIATLNETVLEKQAKKQEKEKK